MPVLSSQDIEYIAQLARLELTDTEKQRYAEQLSVVFDYFEMLREVDVTDVPETCQVTGLEDVAREDVAVACDVETKKKLIEAFSQKVGNVLIVPGVFEN
ncbi:MAG: Asp-tRNA(Asn)/Glu-tRNA(Gln) amidotransferase subunit GatC [Patescibacteria group bacterium]